MTVPLEAFVMCLFLPLYD
ncbi:DUF1196 domain-containing protein [Vibrio anguillarum]|nr:DUF1196 domain-containing protein [Vibrio anguillarum]NNN97765.1 DUF1196 domain-containing protein [Vibrio sp. B4-6]